MMLYLVSNKIPDIYVSVNWCANFTHNTKVSHDIYVRRICQYLQGNVEKCILLNISKKMVVYFYLYADFVGLWRHQNPQDPICARSRTEFVVTFPIFLYCGYQIYIHILLSIIYILSMWNCIILL